MEGSVCDAEMHMAGFISEQNLSFNIMDHFSDLLPKLCPDSKIAHFKSKRMKSKCIQNAKVADVTLNFSVIIDDTTNVSTVKELVVVSRV